MKIFFILLLNIPLFLHSQINLKGIVLDSTNSQPIPYATVFINGTTKGSITNLNGAFEIDNITIPAQVILSHIGYSRKILNLNNTNSKNVEIKLNSKKRRATRIFCYQYKFA